MENTMYALRICCAVLLTLFVGSGNVLAKKPKNEDVEVSGVALDVVRIEACIDDTDECIIAGGPKQIELIDLAGGNIDFAKKVLLPENTTELRLVLGSNSTIVVDDETFPLTVPSGQTSGLKLKGEDVFSPESGFLTSMTLELNLDRALTVRGKKSVSYALKPVLQVGTAELEALPENMAGAVVLPGHEGLVKLGDAFSLFIPAGAVSEETIITAEEIKYFIELKDEVTGAIVKEPGLASTYKLAPEGTLFAKPLELAIRYNIEALPPAITENDLAVFHDGERLLSNIDTISQVATANIIHFSSVTVSYGECEETEIQDGIRHRNCGAKIGYPDMHVVLIDRSKLSDKYNLMILADDSLDGTFTTQTVGKLSRDNDAIVAINGSYFEGVSGIDKYEYPHTGAYPSYTTVMDGGLRRYIERSEVFIAFGDDGGHASIPIERVTKENFKKHLEGVDPVKSLKETKSLDDPELFKFNLPNILSWAIGTDATILEYNSGDESTCKPSGSRNEAESAIGYTDEEIIFVVSDLDSPTDKEFDTWESLCETFRVHGDKVQAVELDHGCSAQLTVNGELKNGYCKLEPGKERHVVNAIGLVCTTPKYEFTDSDATHIIHPTKYRCSNNLCWAPSWKPNMDLAEGDLNCWDADKWFEIKDGDICGDRTERDRSICDEVYANDDSTITCESSDGKTQEGETCTAKDKEQDPGEDIPSGQPDMDVQTSTLGNGQHTERHRRLTADPGESIYGFVKIRNKGDGNADDVNVSFYLDAGDIDFKREEKDFIAAHYVGKFFVGQEIRYVVGFHAPEEPGKYTFYGCIDNSDDSKYENNCPIMKNEDEYARLTVEEPPPDPSDLTAHSLRLNNGATTLTGCSIFGLTVGVTNAGVGDAESNFQILHEINGPSTGYTWKPLAESRFTPVPLYAGSSDEHRTGDQLAAAPEQAGNYRIRSCVDSGGVISESKEGNNCSEELTVEILPSLGVCLKPVYRFWSDQNRSHFYTISKAEKNNVIADYTDYEWRYENVAWCAYTQPEEGSLPVYRFWSEQNQSHFYTISETEKNNVINNYTDYQWKYEHIEWYAFNYAKAGTIPVYRFWSDENMSHFYTASGEEKQYVEDNYTDYEWKYEHEAWWVYPSCTTN